MASHSDKLRDAKKILFYAQAEVERLEGVPPGTAPDADGWIDWEGGKCPVDDGVLVDVETRSGKRYITSVGYYFDWRNNNYDCDIVAYRLSTEGAE